MEEAEKEKSELEVYLGVDEIQKHSKWFLVIGALMIFLGVIAISMAILTTLFSVLFLALMLVCAGIVQGVNSFKIYRGKAFVLHLLTSIFYCVMGVLALVHPAVVAITLTLILGTLYFVGGIFRSVVAVVEQFPQWGWILFGGLVSTLLGLLILLQWPESGLWVLGLFVGVDMIALGWVWVMLGWAVQKK